MKKKKKWLLELAGVAILMLLVGEATTRFFEWYNGKDIELLAKILVQLYLLVVGLVVELIRWAHDNTLEQQEEVWSKIDSHLISGVDAAVQNSFLRAMFPSGNPDPMAARLHFSLLQEYLAHVEGYLPIIQRASATLARRHFAKWREEMGQLSAKPGLLLTMEESAAMSRAMIEGRRDYLIIERAPVDPARSWSPGFLKLLAEISARTTLERKFILLIDKTTLWGSEGRSANSTLIDLLLRQLRYLKDRNFSVLFCDESRLRDELGTSELPPDNYEVFGNEVILCMQPADRYDRRLPVRLQQFTELDELGRFVRLIQQHAFELTEANLRTPLKALFG